MLEISYFPSEIRLPFRLLMHPDFYIPAEKKQSFSWELVLVEMATQVLLDAHHFLQSSKSTEVSATTAPDVPIIKLLSKLHFSSEWVLKEISTSKDHEVINNNNNNNTNKIR